MKKIRTDIIPSYQQFARTSTDTELDLKAICIFSAIGFFLDKDTYHKNKHVLAAASTNTLDESNFLIKSEPWFKWHYTPRDLSFDDAVDEFSVLFEKIVNDQTDNKKVILPLSGGIDSRTQAVALRNHNSGIFSYSYEFKNGYQETKIASEIANQLNFQFQSFTINKGYLWKELDSLASINNCYSDFTHPRQMAVIENLKGKGDIFSLGHWGDVLFDGIKVDEDMSLENQTEFVLKKIIKRGGRDIAEDLWVAWELEGNFYEYLYARVYALLNNINIDNAVSRVRAFKSLYWAPRWTAINLAIFRSAHSISLPYFDNRMCQFICTVPEEYLADRKIQIAYIKRYNPELAKITWQDQRPYNLFNYKNNVWPMNFPYRIKSKIIREINILSGNDYVQRNWELQFLGEENVKKLKNCLFASHFKLLVPKSIACKFYEGFKTSNTLKYAHPVSMLLTLSMFSKINLD